MKKTTPLFVWAMERSTTLHVSNTKEASRTSRGAARLRFFARLALGAIALLLPVFFLPGFVDGLEMPKQTLLAFLSAFAVLAWLGAMLADRQVSFRGGFAHILPVAFLLLAAVSSALSSAPVSSWLGTSQLALSFLSCASLLGVGYVAMHLAADTRTQGRLILLLLLGALVSVALFFSSAFGLLPLFSPGVTVIGNVISFGVFLLTVVFLSSALWMADVTQEGKALLHGVHGWVFGTLLAILALSTLFFLLIVDVSALWVVALLASGATLAFASLSPRIATRPSRFLLSFLFCVTAAVFLAFPSPVRLSNVPGVSSLNYTTSVLVVRDGLLEQGIVHTLFGSGAGTFGGAYLLHRPEGVNATLFWNTRFDEPVSHLLSVIYAFGLVGGGVLILLFVLLAVRAVSTLVFERDREEWGMAFALSVGWFTLVCAHILLPSTLALLTVLALLSGLLASQVYVRVHTSDFARAPRTALFASFTFVVLAVGCIGGAAYAGARLGGDVLFSAAIRADRAGAPTAEVIQHLERASALDALSVPLIKNLAAARLRSVKEQIRAAGSAPTPEQIQSIRSMAFSAIQTAERASILAPKDASVWALRAQIYRDLMPYTPGAEDYAASAYARAIALDPMNPQLQTDLGRVSLLVAVRARAAASSTDETIASQAKDAEAKALTGAEEAFQKAIALKSDYAPAHYFLAGVYERQNRLDEAAERLDLLLASRSGDVGLLLERALVDVRRERLPEARAVLEQIVVLSPTYSNAWWYLSSVAEAMGERSRAIDAAKRVLELNPENTVAIERLNQLSQLGEEGDVLPEPLEDAVIPEKATRE